MSHRGQFFVFLFFNPIITAAQGVSMAVQRFEGKKYTRMRNKYQKKFKGFKEKTASERDFNKVLKNEKNILFKAGRGKLLELKGDVKLLLEMVKAFLRGEYHEIPTGSISAIVFTLLYVFSLMDLIPDFIVGLGLADDAGMVILCLNLIKKDIDKFKAFKEHKESGGEKTQESAYDVIENK